MVGTENAVLSSPCGNKASRARTINIKRGMSLTSIIRPILTRRLKETSLYSGYGEEIQQKETVW